MTKGGKKKRALSQTSPDLTNNLPVKRSVMNDPIQFTTSPFQSVNQTNTSPMYNQSFQQQTPQTPAYQLQGYIQQPIGLPCYQSQPFCTPAKSQQASTNTIIGTDISQMQSTLDTLMGKLDNIDSKLQKLDIIEKTVSSVDSKKVYDRA